MSPNERIAQFWRLVPSLALAAFVGTFFLMSNNREVNKVYYLAILPLALVTARLDDYRALWQNRTLRAALVFTGYLCITVLWSGLLPREAGGEALTDALSVLALLLLTVAASRRVELTERLALWLVGLTTIHALVTLMTWYSAHGLDERMLGLGRLDHPIQLAAVQAASGALAGVWFMSDRSAPSRWLAVTAVVCAISIIATASRGPLLAFGGVILGGALLLRNGRAIGLSVALGMTGIVAVVLEPSLLDGLTARGTSFRPEIWSAAWDRIDDDWLLGHGLGSPATLVISGVEFRHFHSIVLMAWYYGGVIAVLLLLFMIGAALQRGLQNPVAWPWLGAFTAGFLCQLPDGGPPLTNPHPAWLYLWLPLAMVALANAPETKTAPEGAV